MNCRACILACQQRNGVPYGCARNWIKAHYTAGGEALAPLYGWHFQPGGCMQCDEPLCVKACPTKATYKGKDGVVHVDENRCIGCSSCIAACPYQARFKHPVYGIADKCDYCLEGREHGLEPACVHVCPTRARIFGDADDPSSKVAKAIAEFKAENALSYVESRESPTRPSLAYLGHTQPVDWPRRAELPPVLAAMGPVSTAIKWLGGLTLLGVTGVFIKQFIMPSEDGGPDDPPGAA
jgi:Fe-S-cluster-containing dehydrogenase component